jgi:hypothetical protein
MERREGKIPAYNINVNVGRDDPYGMMSAERSSEK